jgi:hypothetical protein
VYVLDSDEDRLVLTTEAFSSDPVALSLCAIIRKMRHQGVSEDITIDEPDPAVTASVMASAIEIARATENAAIARDGDG